MEITIVCSVQLLVAGRKNVGPTFETGKIKAFGNAFVAFVKLAHERSDFFEKVNKQ